MCIGRKVFFFSFLSLFLAFAGCGDEDDNGLALGLSPTETYLLPGSGEIDDGCYDGELSELRLQFDVFQTQWTGDGSFLPIAMEVILRDGDGEQVCTISPLGDASFGAFLGYGGDTLENADGSGTVATSLCAIACGGYSADENQSLNGEINLLGIQIDSEGTQIPIESSVDFRARSL